MSGIAGIFHVGIPKPVDPTRVERMCDVMVHRGPDGSGVWTAPGVALGHRRLAIIDIEGSAQPMPSSDGRAILTFNGEIYNYRELREELQAKGARFHTNGDSEVILAAWQEWGVECPSRLDGMFAFAIYDLDQRSLFIARDRLGVKPLLFANLSDGSLIFGSELKALLAHPLLRRDLDPLAIDDYLAWGYVPDARSILKSVCKLPAGHYLIVRQGAEMPEPVCWWDISFAERRSGRVADLEAELLHLLRRAVASRMGADVPLGAFLSGDPDSSSIVALMAEASANPVRTSSIGFDVRSSDEAGHARRVAELLGTDHDGRIYLTDDFEAMEMLGGMFDEPFADASALSAWRLCQLARERVAVALSGDGANEALAGSRRHVDRRNEDRLRSMLPAGLRIPIFGTLGRLYPKAGWAPDFLRAKSAFQSLAANSEAAYARTMSVTPNEIRERLYTQDFLALRGDYRAEQPFEALMRDAPARSGLDRAQYADLKFSLPGGILTKADRTSMAVSLEVREPLLDHRLIEFFSSLPEAMRVSRGQGRWLMKQAMRRYLPDEILRRPNQRFSPPIAQWFRGPLIGAAREIVRRAPLAKTGWIERGSLSAMIETHARGVSDHSRLIWQLFILDRSLERLGIS